MKQMSRSMATDVRNNVYGLDSVINFGKNHKGKKLSDVLETNPDYIMWAIDTIDWFKVDFETETLLKQMTEGVNIWDDVQQEEKQQKEKIWNFEE